ncbi:hypothetical protein [Roseomonas acroporae]|nr:hypothetical protein [Roseomonas acroporae]
MFRNRITAACARELLVDAGAGLYVLGFLAAVEGALGRLFY